MGGLVWFGWFDTVFLCNLSYPGTHSNLDQADLKFKRSTYLCLPSAGIKSQLWFFNLMWGGGTLKCVCTTCMQVQESIEVRTGVKSLRTGVTIVSHHMGTGNETWVLCKDSKYFLTAELCLQPPIHSTSLSCLITSTIHKGATKMAQLLKCLPCKYEDLSSNP